LTPSVNVAKLFTDVGKNRLTCLSLASFIQAILIFASNAGKQSLKRNAALGQASSLQILDHPEKDKTH
jgi:hypothetical protein